MARDPERAKAGGGGAKQILEAGVLVRELQRFHQIVFVAGAVDVEEADGGRDRRLRLPRRRALDGRQRLERALVADLPQRERGIVLQRAIELGDGRQRVEGVLRLVVAERLDHGAAEEVLAAADVAHERLLTRTDVGRCRSRSRAPPARG